VSYASGAVTPLDTSSVPLTSPQDRYTCWSVTSLNAACGVVFGGRSRVAGIFVIPLDGGASIATAKSATGTCLHGAVLIKTTAAWIGCGHHLTTLTSHHTRSSAEKYFGSPAAGLHRFLESDPSVKRGIAVTTTFAAKTIVAPHRENVAASWFTVTNGTVVWKETHHSLRAPLAVQRRSVGLHHDHVKASAITTVGRTGSAHAPLSISGKSTLYAVNSGAPNQTVIITGPGKTRRIHNLNQNFPANLSAHRVVFLRKGQAHVLNLHNGKGLTIPAATAVISGKFVDYVTPDGILKQRNLSTGSERTVTQGLRPSAQDTDLFAFGKAVGWNGFDAGDDGDEAGYQSPGKPITVLAHEGIWSLNDAGVITYPRSNFYGPPDSLVKPRDLYQFANESFSLRPYDSNQEKIVLTGSYLIDGPQVSHGVMAWIDPGGILRARPLTHH
jgi:hypothetical protein